LGETIDDLSRLETANPALKRIGFIGPSRVGKSTLLRTLQAQIPDGVVTDEPYAVVVLLQTTPVTYFGLIDAAGQAYAQQFKVFNAADKVIILSTHQFYPDAQSGGSGNPNVTILTMRRSPLVNQDKRPRLRFLG
jgi:hypothetical protein